MKGMEKALESFLKKNNKVMTDKDREYVRQSSKMIDTEMEELGRTNMMDIFKKGKTMFDKYIVDTISFVICKHGFKPMDTLKVLDIYKDELSLEMVGKIIGEDEGFKEFAKKMREKKTDKSPKVIKIETDDINVLREKLCSFLDEDEVNGIINEVEGEIEEHKRRRSKGIIERVTTSQLFTSITETTKCEKCGIFHREAANNEGDTINVGQTIAKDFMAHNNITEDKLSELRDCLNILTDFVTNLKAEKTTYC